MRTSFHTRLRPRTSHGCVHHRIAWVGRGLVRALTQSPAESRVSGGTRAGAWDCVHSGVEMLCDRGEGSGVVLMRSSGRRLAHIGNGCSIISTEWRSFRACHTDKHLRMEKNFWQREKGATCTLVCSYHLYFFLIRLCVNTDYKKNNMAHLWQKLVIFISIS